MKSPIFILVLLVALFQFANAQYVSLTEWYYNGCTETDNNFVYDLNLYPADGHCFSPGSYGTLYPYYSYQIFVNNTNVDVITYGDTNCTYPYYSTSYLVDQCSNNYYSAAVYATLPPPNYWLTLNLTGYYGHWDVVLVTDYYATNTCGQWNDAAVSGYSSCYYGDHYYCQNGAIHYDYCSSSTCDTGCTTDYYPPLNQSCQIWNGPGWYMVEDTLPSQSFCVDASTPVPSASPSSSPSRAPSASRTPSPIAPSSFPSSSVAPSVAPSMAPGDSSSSDEPSEGVWVLLMIICFLVGVIVGLLLGLVLYSKLSAKKQQDINNGYIPLPPYGMPVPFLTAPQIHS